MRTAVLALSLLIAAAVAGCGVDPAPSTEASQLDDLAGVDPAAFSCPLICGEGTLCALPSGACQEACNPCLCKARGGHVVAACPASAAQPEPPVDDFVFGGGACGSTTCGPGTHCCNASCGVCVGPGGVCTQQVCNPTN
jgi:hypothetical protein